MAGNIEVCNQVYVCRSRLQTVNDQTKAFYKSEVVGRQNRSVSVGYRMGLTVISYPQSLSTAAWASLCLRSARS